MNNKIAEALRLGAHTTKQYVLDVGGCDHSVGICVCAEIRQVAQIETAISLAEVVPDVVEALRKLCDYEKLPAAKYRAKYKDYKENKHNRRARKALAAYDAAEKGEKP